MIRPGPPASAAPRIALRGWSRDWGWSLAMAALLLLGGGNWTMPLPRFLAEAIAVGLLVCALGAGPRAGRRRMVMPDWIVLAMLALFAAHLLPLPPALWTALPGREIALAADRALTGEPGWRPLTLDREATLRALLMLLPALSIYIAARLGDAQRQRALLRGVALALVAAAALALAQTAAPDAGWLQPYPRGDYAWPIGFFTNRNHHAAFACMALPLVAAWFSGRSRPQSGPDWMLAGLSLLTAALVLATASRAGAALLPLALAGTWLAAQRPDRGVSRRPRTLALLAGAGLLAGLGVLALGGDGLLGVLQRDNPLSDQRFEYWPLVGKAAMHFWPVGSGLGTFLTGYEMIEPLDSLGPLYLNHAHNDYLEILLEAGIPGLVLALIAVWELALLAIRRWHDGLNGATGRLAAVAMGLPLLHALVDYPLRTIALSCLFALAAALLLPVQNDRGDESPAGS